MELAALRLAFAIASWSTVPMHLDIANADEQFADRCHGNQAGKAQSQNWPAGNERQMRPPGPLRRQRTGQTVDAPPGIV